MAHAQNAARALFEAGCLEAFVTTFTYRSEGQLASVLARAPGEGAKRLSHQLARRAIEQVPSNLVHSYPGWELIHTAASLFGAGTRYHRLSLGPDESNLRSNDRAAVRQAGIGHPGIRVHSPRCL